MDMKGMDMKGMDMKGMNMKGMNMGDDAEKAEFARLDANHDGKLSRAELPAKHPLAPHFEMLDANHDGSLSPGEFAAGRGM
jgi:Ca2+-binding EF-hand superfamily protein